MAEGYPQAGPPACGDIQKNPKSFGFGFLAPQVGLEPTTTRLTAGCSTIELWRNISIRPVRNVASVSREEIAAGEHSFRIP